MKPIGFYPIEGARALMRRRADNDNRRVMQRTRADEQFILIGLGLGASVLFVAIMWVLD
jgi:hypothetical protein